MKITFESFLYGMPSRDYIHQQADYDTQIQAAARKLKQADYVLIGAGAGMSTAAVQSLPLLFAKLQYYISSDFHLDQLL